MTNLLARAKLANTPSPASRFVDLVFMILIDTLAAFPTFVCPIRRDGASIYCALQQSAAGEGLFFPGGRGAEGRFPDLTPRGRAGKQGGQNASKRLRFSKVIAQSRPIAASAPPTRKHRPTPMRHQIACIEKGFAFISSRLATGPRCHLHKRRQSLENCSQKLYAAPDGNRLHAREAAITSSQYPGEAGSLALPPENEIDAAHPAKVPEYLESIYWWAYVRPWAIKLFERDWLVELILWGWYRPLEDAALEMLGNDLPGRTLQIACVYGEFVPKLCKRVEESGGELDVVDVVEAQLENLKNKLPRNNAARLLQMDSSDMAVLPSASYDRVVLFFLMHEQPSPIRRRTISEAFRVVKPGGQVLFVEFSKAKWWHPLRYTYLQVLKHFEPFAPDIWDHDDVEFWLSKPFADKIEQRRFLFGNYYQVFSVRA